MSIESVMPSNHLILCRPLLYLPSILPSINIFSNESVVASGGQSIKASASPSALPMNIQGWFPFWLTGLIFLLSKGISVFSAPWFESISSSALSLFYCVALTSIHNYCKNHIFDYRDFRRQSFAIASLPRSKCLLISWLQSPSAVLLEPKKIVYES